MKVWDGRGKSHLVTRSSHNDVAREHRGGNGGAPGWQRCIHACIYRHTVPPIACSGRPRPPDKKMHAGATGCMCECMHASFLCIHAQNGRHRAGPAAVSEPWRAATDKAVGKDAYRSCGVHVNAGLQ
eukprot:356634-Chlamydomonas_euryale.AAC.3